MGAVTPTASVERMGNASLYKTYLQPKFETKNTLRDWHKGLTRDSQKVVIKGLIESTKIDLLKSVACNLSMAHLDWSLAFDFWSLVPIVIGIEFLLILS